MKKDMNSLKNQEIKSKFVDREVFANVNQMVEYIISKEDREAPFTFEDIENFYSYPEWSNTVLGENLYFGGGSENDKNEFLANFDRLTEETEELFNKDEISEATYDRNLLLIAEAREEVEKLETEPAEIYEYWLVSSWLCEKLAKQGYPVIKDQNIWCRTTTGQAILLDYAISQICEGMEILEGQKNQW